MQIRKKMSRHQILLSKQRLVVCGLESMFHRVFVRVEIAKVNRCHWKTEVCFQFVTYQSSVAVVKMNCFPYADSTVVYSNQTSNLKIPNSSLLFCPAVWLVIQSLDKGHIIQFPNGIVPNLPSLRFCSYTHTNLL